jgi:hypothetical protein
VTFGARKGSSGWNHLDESACDILYIGKLRVFLSVYCSAASATAAVTAFRAAIGAWLNCVATGPAAITRAPRSGTAGKDAINLTRSTPTAVSPAVSRRAVSPAAGTENGEFIM